jgi:RNA polymerase sigma factor (sigma-70 family)
MAAGDCDAIARFYGQHFEMMFLEARNASRRDEQFCLDVVQEAMLKVIRSIRPMDAELQLTTWTRRLVRNATYDQLRTEIRRRKREARSAARPNELSKKELEALEAQATWLASELEEMAADKSYLLIARYGWGWSLRQIGADLGISAGTVDARIRRLLRRLRQRYRETVHDK